MTFNTYKTAKEIWDRLNARFQKEEGLSKTLIWERFFSFKFNANSTVTSHRPDLENLLLKLADISLTCPIISSWIWYGVSYLLSGLPSRLKCIDWKSESHLMNSNDSSILRIKIELGRIWSRWAKPHRLWILSPGLININRSPRHLNAVPPLAKKTYFMRKKVKCHNRRKWGHWAVECKGTKKEVGGSLTKCNTHVDRYLLP